MVIDAYTMMAVCYTIKRSHSKYIALLFSSRAHILNFPKLVSFDLEHDAL